jgi:hypothetical protein
LRGRRTYKFAVCEKLRIIKSPFYSKTLSNMRFALSFLAPLGAAAAALQPNAPLPFFNNVTIFTPPHSWTSQSTSYGRSLLLNQNCEKDNVLLTTFTESAPGLPQFPIYKSTDGGLHWKKISSAYFKATNASQDGIILQPFLFELPKKVGNYPAGTVLISGNAIPKGFNNGSSTNIELHASKDQG